jgi:hypothetical protein
MMNSPGTLKGNNSLAVLTPIDETIKTCLDTEGPHVPEFDVCVERLAEFGEQGIERLIELLDGEAAEIRLAMSYPHGPVTFLDNCEALVARLCKDYPAMQDPLVDYLYRDLSSHSAILVRGLGSIDNVIINDCLMHVLSTSSEYRNRAAAAQKLLEHRYEKAAKLLRDCIYDESYSVINIGYKAHDVFKSS